MIEANSYDFLRSIYSEIQNKNNRIQINRSGKLILYKILHV